MVPEALFAAKLETWIKLLVYKSTCWLKLFIGNFDTGMEEVTLGSSVNLLILLRVSSIFLSSCSFCSFFFLWASNHFYWPDPNRFLDCWLSNISAVFFCSYAFYAYCFLIKCKVSLFSLHLITPSYICCGSSIFHVLSFIILALFVVRLYISDNLPSIGR